METFYRKKDLDTPEIIFDKAQNKFEITGKSLPEDVKTFYNPLLEWIDEYIKDPNKETIVSFRMDYLNTASTKILTELVYRLKALLDNGKKLLVNWHFEVYDYDMKKLGSDISFFTGVPFEYIEYEDD